MVRICVMCGKEFTPTSAAQKTCSLECTRLRRNQRQHEYYVRQTKQDLLKTCQKCGKQFKPTPKLRSYCSKECQMYRKKVGRKTCMYCGKQIIDRTASAKYCSETCRGRMNGQVPFKPEYAEKKRVSNIDDINTQAREKGLSYGKLKALEWVKNNKYDILGENQ